MINVNYNPDVLDAIANLSNDEVFTPPKLVNEILDMLPQELFESKSTTFLDPVSKSGVFLREIAKRLIKGLEKQIPDIQERANHIFQNQLFGIAITELTSLLSRRTVYGTKTANNKYSFCETFKNKQGNIIFNNIQHTWENGKCIYCGASQAVYDRDDSLETHAYQFIHTENPQEIFNMKFDVIIGNPPYQLNVGIEKENYAIPIYHKFVERAKKLNLKFLSMIIPARWFTGGRGLDSFRKEMLNDNKIKIIVDYVDSRDCFPGVDVSGGIMYFLWEKNYSGKTNFTSIHDGRKSTMLRKLNKYSIFPRFNESVTIIDKILSKKERTLEETVSSQTPFGLYTNFKGEKTSFDNSVIVYSSSGKQYISRNKIRKNINLIDKYKVIFSKATSEHGGQVGKSGKRVVLSSIRIIEPNSVCTQSYLIADSFTTYLEAENLLYYMKTKFFRFLLLQATTSQDLSMSKFCFVPIQDYTIRWTDEKLYKKYNLTQEEIDLIESIIRPME